MCGSEASGAVGEAGDAEGHPVQMCGSEVSWPGAGWAAEALLRCGRDRGGLPEGGARDEPVVRILGVFRREGALGELVRGTAVAPGHLGRVTREYRVREETLVFYRRVERAFERLGLDIAFEEFLVLAFWQQWAPWLGVSDVWEQVYRQACYECSSPVCFRTDCTCHHVRYRAHGGTDDAENLTAPCAFCHLWGEHEGRLKVTGTAAFLVWLLGRKPILEVRGREMRRVA